MIAHCPRTYYQHTHYNLTVPLNFNKLLQISSDDAPSYYNECIRNTETKLSTKKLFTKKIIIYGSIFLGLCVWEMGVVNLSLKLVGMEVFLPKVVGLQFRWCIRKFSGPFSGTFGSNTSGIFCQKKEWENRNINSKMVKMGILYPKYTPFLVHSLQKKKVVWHL